MARVLSAADLAGSEVVGGDAPPAGGGRVLSAADLDGSEVVDQAEAPGIGESVARGAAQGVTMGFADEAVGAGKALWRTLLDPDAKDYAGSIYRSERDKYRADDTKARDTNPWAYGLSELGGGIAGAVATGGTGLGARLGLGAARAGGALAAAGRAAVAGGVAGLGYSESEDLGGQLADAGKSAIVSGAAGGLLHKLVGGAPERVAKRMVGDLTDGATATMRDRVVGAEGKKFTNVIDLLRENPGIKAAGRDAPAQVAAIDEALTRVGGRLNEVYARAGATTPGVPVRDVQIALDGIAKKLESNPGTRNMARAVRSQMDDVFESWVAPNTTAGPGFVVGTPTVSAQELREFAKAVGDNAFAGSPAVSPKAGKQVAQEVWSSVKGLIDKNIDEAAAALGDKGGAAELRALNQKASNLMNMRQAAAYRATREATPSTTLRARGSSLLDLGLAATGNLPSLVAKKAIEHVGIPAGRVADEALAKLAAAAARGNRPAQLATMAVELGLAPTISDAMGTWVSRVLRGVGRGNELEAQ